METKKRTEDGCGIERKIKDRFYEQRMQTAWTKAVCILYMCDKPAGATAVMIGRSREFL